MSRNGKVLMAMSGGIFFARMDRKNATIVQPGKRDTVNKPVQTIANSDR
jgi:hypothetical protein